MDAGIKAKWIEALRSGKYVQGRTMLRTTDDKFCCLGVLGDVCASDKWALHKFGDEGLDYWSFERDDALLPDDFADDRGVPYKTQEQLAEMNDQGKSFIEIADFIEKNL